MKALSLWQPWASLIVHGYKSIETRGYQTNVRGRIAIHATAKEPVGTFAGCLSGIYDNATQVGPYRESLRAMTKRVYGEPLPLKLIGPVPQFDALPRGCIIGTVEIYDCVAVETLREILPAGLKFKISDQEYAFGNYEPGRFAWMLRDPILFREPIPYKGKQGWWDADFRRCRMCGQPAEPGIEHCNECQFAAWGTL